MSFHKPVYYTVKYKKLETFHSINALFSVYKYITLVGFGRACAPVRCAHPSFWTHCHPKRGAARPSPPIAASLLLIRPPKIDKIYRNLGLPRQGLFFFPLDHRDYEIGGPLPPAPLVAASLILPAIFWGQNCVPVRLFINIFLFLSSYPSLLISSYLFLFFFSYIWIC